VPVLVAGVDSCCKEASAGRLRQWVDFGGLFSVDCFRRAAFGAGRLRQWVDFGGLLSVGCFRWAAFGGLLSVQGGFDSGSTSVGCLRRWVAFGGLFSVQNGFDSGSISVGCFRWVAFGGLLSVVCFRWGPCGFLAAVWGMRDFDLCLVCASDFLVSRSPFLGAHESGCGYAPSLFSSIFPVFGRWLLRS
jgi:hypothetical protein